METGSAKLPYYITPGGGDYFDQMVASAVGKVVSGVLRPGDVLPTTDQIEKMLGVSHGLVTKAGKEIERLGVLEGKNKRGRYVAQITAANWKRLQQIDAANQFIPLLRRLRSLNVSTAVLEAAFADALARTRPVT